MAQDTKRKNKLTLRDLASVEVRDTSAPVAVPDTSVEPERRGAEALVDASEHLPDGVSSDVAALLGMPSREEAERAAAESRAAQIEAERAAEAERARQVEEEAARRRLEEEAAAQAAAAEAAAIEAAAAARTKSRQRLGGVAIALVLTIAVGAVVVAMQPSPVDETTEYSELNIAMAAVSASPESSIEFMPIPEPPPPTIVEEEAEPAAARGDRTRRGTTPARETVRRGDLF